LHDTTYLNDSVGFRRLDPGNYPIRITDTISGCFADTSFTITGKPPLYVNAYDSINPRCSGINNGQIILVGLTSSSPIDIYWTSLPSGDTLRSLKDTLMNNATFALDSLYPGNYKVKISDANCTVNRIFSLIAYDSLHFNYTVNNASCSNRGSVLFNFTSGTAPYRIVWSTLGDTTRVPVDSAMRFLIPGNYPIIVYDSIFECTVDTAVIITGKTPIIAAISEINKPRCNNTNDGALEVNILSGETPYDISWFFNSESIQTHNNDTLRSDTLSNIGIGIYNVEIDNSDCSYSGSHRLGSIDTLAIDYPPTIATGDTATCGKPGTMSITINNGKHPFRYFWQGVTPDTVSLGLLQNFTANSLDAGNYELTVMDLMCSISNVVVMPIKDSIAVLAGITPLTCIDSGTISVQIISPVKVDTLYAKWSDINKTDTLTQNILKERKNLAAGIYRLDLSTNTGCASTKIFTVEAHDTILVNAGLSDTLCRGDSATLHGYAWPVLGGGYLQPDSITKFQWSILGVNTNLNGFYFYNNTDTLTVAYTRPYTPDMYKVKYYDYVLDVTYGKHCKASDTVPYIFYPTTGVTFAANHDTTVGNGVVFTLVPLIGGVGEYNKYQWIVPAGLIGPDTLKQVEMKLQASNQKYQVVFIGTTNDGCRESDTIHIAVISAVNPRKVFTPNGDKINDFWYIENAEYYPDIHVDVFNRWGQGLFSCTGYQNREGIAWDGKYNGKPLPVGTYYYVITIKSASLTKTGSVTILR
jgi:gliding motility-associated-like protein